MALLEDLGFEWRLQEGHPGCTEAQEAQWEERLAELLAFKAEHGHCRVPQTYKPNPPLGWWVSTQRQLAWRQKLKKHRQRRLQGVGFVWRVGRGRGSSPGDRA